jgi:polysaccharide deacetylase 2 family uncharacterized protein YibQ
MEPVSKVDPQPGEIFNDTSESEAVKILSENLDEVSDAVGMNNHMGSLVTQNEKLMRAILGEIKRRGLFYVDSYTISTTVGFKVAQTLGVPTGRNEIFLDGQADVNYVKQQILSLANKAKSLPSEQHFGIGHIRPKTIDAISQSIDTLKTMNVHIINASSMVR